MGSDRKGGNFGLTIAFVFLGLCSLSVSGIAQTISATPPDQDIWTTSVYSFAPGGGGPGGGLANGNLVVGGYGDLYYSLLQFNLTNLPASASNVELQLYDQTSPAGATPTAVNLYQITQPPQSWNWQTGLPGAPDNQRLWWQNQPTATLYSATPLSAPTPNSYYDIDITSLYNGWQSGTIPNDGVELQPVNNQNNYDFFGSSRNPVAAFEPTLIITVGMPTSPVPTPTSAPSISDLPLPSTLFSQIPSFVQNLPTDIPTNSQAFFQQYSQSATLGLSPDIKSLAAQAGTLLPTFAGVANVLSVANLPGDVDDLLALAGARTASLGTSQYLDLPPWETLGLQAGIGVLSVGAAALLAPEYVPTLAAGATFLLLSSATADALDAVSQDPPDPNYTTVYVPSIPQIPQLPSTGNPQNDRLLTDMLTNAVKVTSYLQAISVSFNRYSGAIQAGDAIDALQQLEAILYYLNFYNSTVSQLRPELTEVASLIPSENIPFDPSTLADLQTQFQDFGFTADDIAFFTGLGLDAEQISELGDALLSLDPNEFAGITLDSELPGIVNSIDTTTTESVPEPSSFLLLLTGALILFIGRLIREFNNRSMRVCKSGQKRRWLSVLGGLPKSA